MSGLSARRLDSPRSIAGVKPVAVALRREVAVELGDEQAAVREDQDAERARCLDEAGGGDRLAGRGRMAEAEAPDGARVLAPAKLGSSSLVVDLAPRARARRPRSSSSLLGTLLGDGPVAVAVSSSACSWFAAISSVSMPASASTWWRRSSVPAAVFGGRLA